MPLNRYFFGSLISCSDSLSLYNTYITNIVVTYTHPFPDFAITDTLAEQERQEKLIYRTYNGHTITDFF